MKLFRVESEFSYIEKSNISKSRKLYKDRCTGVGPFLSGVQN
ncbi:MAG TPA: hypothetical protein PLI47_03320 [Bacteroidia bacterium]|nr:hypothetical protein [Bacteroidia bacterium]